MRAGVVDRLLWSTLASGLLAVLVLARLLTPSPSGVGTHVALGLAPCGFLRWSGLPCPACGLTTAFAHLARAELLPALRANPMGVPLFVGTVVLLPLATKMAIRPASFAVVVDRLRADRWALGLVLALLVSWAARLIALTQP